MSNNRSAVAIPAAWYRDACDKLQSFRSLEAGWNGFEAEPPSDMAITQARKVLRVLHELRFKPTRIDPSAEGGVGLTFLAGDLYGDIECFNSGEILAATSDRIHDPDVWELGATDSEIAATVQRIRTHVTH